RQPALSDRLHDHPELSRQRLRDRHLGSIESRARGLRAERPGGHHVSDRALQRHTPAFRRLGWSAVRAAVKRWVVIMGSVILCGIVVLTLGRQWLASREHTTTASEPAAANQPADAQREPVKSLEAERSAS